jgi:hypothetical protein
MTPADLKARMQAAVAGAAPSMVPAPKEFAPKGKEKEVVPDVHDLIVDPSERMELIRLVNLQITFGQQESAAKKSRAPLTDAIKKILGKFKLGGKMLVGGNRLNYYSTTSYTVDRAILLAQGVPAMVTGITRVLPGKLTADEEEALCKMMTEVINDCTSGNTSYTLKTTAGLGAGEEDAG